MSDSYRRRYFPGFEASTAMIQDNAITRSKIAPGSVSSEELEDGAVNSDDIAANAITTIKIAAAAVTAEKLASGIIDPTKLTFVPLTRPLTTPITTAEIADGAVTLPKLAAGAISGSTLADRSVPAVKLVADSITSDELAALSVGQTELEADSVGEDELQDNAVALANMQDDSVDTDELVDDAVDANKLAALAVVTGSIVDDAVTEPKLDPGALAARHMLSVYRRLLVYRDPTTGAVIDPSWAESGDAGGIAAPLQGRYRIQTDGDINDIYRINHNGKNAFDLDTQKPTMQLQVHCPDTSDIKITIGLIENVNNAIYLQADTSVDNNWKLVTISGGVPTTVDTGIAIAASWKSIALDWVSTSLVDLYIDNFVAPVAVSTTNIPVGIVQPFVEVETLAASSKKVDVANFSIVSLPIDHDVAP